MQYRIGQGLDVHGFTDGDHVMLGGIRIPHDMGLAAHSDGDVALHALCDALLGAAALGDIGQHFPPDDERWRDVDSSLLLSRVCGMLQEMGWKTVNLDITIACERPRIGPHVPDMCQAVSDILGLDKTAVSIKATTTEQLGFCGRGEGIVALAVVLIASD